MAALSFILSPASSEISISSKVERKQQFPAASIPKQHYHHSFQSESCHQNQQQCQYQQDQAHYPSPVSEAAELSPESDVVDTPTPQSSVMQPNIPLSELVRCQRHWEAIHKRTVKQLAMIKDAEKGLYTPAELNCMLCASFKARIVP